MINKKFLRPYNPYDFSGLEKLMQFCYSLGWYGGTLDLLTITMKGGFEAFSGRASETWEHRFRVQNCAVPELGIGEYWEEGETLNQACLSLLYTLEGERDGERGFAKR